VRRRRSPRSNALTAWTDRPAIVASSSCVKPAASRRALRCAPNDPVAGAFIRPHLTATVRTSCGRWVGAAAVSRDALRSRHVRDHYHRRVTKRAVRKRLPGSQPLLPPNNLRGSSGVACTPSTLYFALTSGIIPLLFFVAYGCNSSGTSSVVAGCVVSCAAARLRLRDHIQSQRSMEPFSMVVTFATIRTGRRCSGPARTVSAMPHRDSYDAAGGPPSPVGWRAVASRSL